MGLVTLNDIKAARERIAPAARVTPLFEVPFPRLTSAPGAGSRLLSPDSRLYLKAESLQPMGAFKIRGAYNMIAQLTPEQLTRGVITYSSGNHGQAVAMAAQLLGAPAVIVMPTTAPTVKVEGALSYGAEVDLRGHHVDRSPHPRAAARAPSAGSR